MNVYEAFIEGAKGGIQTSLTIIPYLVGMLVAISVIRNSGVLGYVVQRPGMGVRAGLGLDTAFTPALPTALMKPLSGSGSKAMMIDAMKTYGVDSFVGRLACIFQGSADTTFYIVALYFGSVGVRKTRYAISCGLIADLAGIIAAICRGLRVLRLIRTKDQHVPSPSAASPPCCLPACWPLAARPRPVAGAGRQALRSRQYPGRCASARWCCAATQTDAVAPGRPPHAAGLDHETGDDPGRPGTPWARCSAAAPNCARPASCEGEHAAAAT